MEKLHVTKGSNKMNGVFSINTPTTGNAFCEAMSKTDSVCASCYAQRYETIRPNIVKAFKRNAKLLTSKVFEPPRFNYQFMRFHSFGELINKVHFFNFVKIALVNPETIFTLWTKRKNIVQEYIRKGGVVPSNMILIYSNPRLNHEMKKPPKGFAKVFNVHHKKKANESGININCGSKSCLDCRLCYSLNNVEVVNEIKK